LAKSAISTNPNSARHYKYVNDHMSVIDASVKLVTDSVKTKRVLVSS